MSDNLVQQALQRIAVLERKLANTVVEGVVVEVQAKPYRVKVDYGEKNKPQLTGWLPVAPFRAGMADSWWPLDVGEGVTIISVDGALERGRVFPARYTESNVPPSENLDECQLNFGDGGYIHYNRATSEGAFKAPSKITLDSDVHITKTLTVDETSTAADHLSGDDLISGKGHNHNESIGSVTSKPNKP
ncbi:hypothetical protein AB835_11675 [Candidatus Endobugula sertula]|uniref:Gp5/Type VI secretion system Vgr protein OB-fold domain-containing protein n=1 Tax=Candidatus Endobugula sertula TaxID=62101 RepID=A0A1D2QMX7_9GAMM|nr:hypothetical protein AB835_11675 [Candidatus Endobugula sertula]